MEEVTLSETETRYYSDLFVCCDVEKTGKIATLKATELYRSANIPDEVINEIKSLAGIPDTVLHISRAQFYSCLKLIAAYQAGVPLRQELVAATVQLPLPRFSWKESPSNLEDPLTPSTSSHPHPHPHTHPHASKSDESDGAHAQAVFNVRTNGMNQVLSDRKNSLTKRGDWPENAIRTESRRNSASQQHQEAVANSDVPSTDSEVEQNESSCGGAAGTSSSREHNRRRGSAEAWSTNSDSPTPTNSVTERPWAKETLWQGLGDEHRQLLGTEEESSDRHSSDDDNDDTDLEAVYQITPEQREYYHKQFKAVQHDPSGLLSGQVARVFFEKSRIPVEELRHIWQLCDVTRDGALSLAEFTAAMHLVVLRRNNIPLPAVLPACLHPSMLQHGAVPPHPHKLAQPQEPPEADLLHLNDDDDDEENTDNTIISSTVASNQTAATAGMRVSGEKNVMNISTLSASSQTSTNSRQCIAPGTTNHMGSLGSPPLQPPPLPAKNRSISNSPNAPEPTTSPPTLPPAAGAGAGSGAGAVAKSKDRALWATDAQPSTQWTKFTESPTSNVSSPGPKPVNFDMQRTAQAVVSDPQILHPVPLRVTPVAGAMGSSSGTELSSSNDDSSIMRDNSPKQLSANSSGPTSAATAGSINTIAAVAHHRDSLQSNDLRAIQRPQAKKLPAKNIGALPPPPQRESSIGGVGSSNPGTNAAAAATTTTTNNNTTTTTTSTSSGSGSNCNSISNVNSSSTGSGSAELDGSIASHHQAAGSGLPNKKDPPPLPPPRPHRHGRSSSLDLNKFKLANTVGGQPAEMMAQTSFDLQTSTGFADFTNFPDGGVMQAQSEQQHSLPQTLSSANNVPAVPPPLRFSLQSNQRVSAFEVYRKPKTPRNSQSPPQPRTQAPIAHPQLPAEAMHAHTHTHTHGHGHAPPSAPAAPAAGPTATAAAVAVATSAAQTLGGAAAALPNADAYEKRVFAISESLRHVSFKQDNINMPDVLRYLREQNNLLLRLCNDLSDELLTVQTRKEEMRLRLEAAASELSAAALTASMIQTTRTGSSISAPVTANVTGGSGSSGGMHSNV